MTHLLTEDGDIQRTLPSDPQNLDGKALISRNAWKGGHRQQMRELVRMVNAEVIESRALLATC